MESSPFRVIPLLSDSSPCQGISFFRYRERTRRRLILETVLEESRIVALAFSFCIYIRMLHFNICCIKEKLLTLLKLLDIVDVL